MAFVVLADQGRGEMPFHHAVDGIEQHLVVFRDFEIEQVASIPRFGCHDPARGRRRDRTIFCSPLHDKNFGVSGGEDLDGEDRLPGLKRGVILTALELALFESDASRMEIIAVGLYAIDANTAK